MIPANLDALIARLSMEKGAVRNAIAFLNKVKAHAADLGGLTTEQRQWANNRITAAMEARDTAQTGTDEAYNATEPIPEEEW